MNQKRLDGFNAKVKAARDAVDEFVDGCHKNEWFERNLENKMRAAIENLIEAVARPRQMSEDEKARLNSALNNE